MADMKTSKTPSPFEGQDRNDEVKDMQNNIMQNGIDDQEFR